MHLTPKTIGSGWLTVMIMVTALTAAGSDAPLIVAVQEGNQESIRWLLSQQVDVNASEPDGTTALAWAAHRDDQESVELLIRAGADVNAANDYGATPLSQACTKGNAAIVQRLLLAGADPNTKLVKGETALMTCARTGSMVAVKALLDHGADPNTREPWRWQTALMWAVGAKHSGATKVLIERGADVQAQTRGGFTPLMFAAQQGDLDSARALVRAGADVNATTPQYGSVLMVAAAAAHEELALYLLEQGADPNQKDIYGITALHHAVQKGFSRMTGIRFDSYRVAPPNLPRLVKALLAKGADPNARITKTLKLRADDPPIDMTGATPFFLAAVATDADLMRLLAASGADPLLPNDKEITPLMAAARGACPGECASQGQHMRDPQWEKDALEAVQVAVELGADVNAVDQQLRSAMHVAAFTGADSIVQYLADQGTHVDQPDDSGETPWTMASGISANLEFRGGYGHHPSTAALLLRLGATPRGREGMDPRSRLAKLGAAAAYEDDPPELIDPDGNQTHP